MTDTIQVEKKWFIYVKDHHEGPYAVAEILEGVRTGKFPEPAYVWHQQLPDWMSIDELPEFQIRPPEFTNPKFQKPEDSVPPFRHLNEESTNSRSYSDIQVEKEGDEVEDLPPIESTEPSIRSSSRTNSDLFVEIRPLGKKNAEPSPVAVEENERSRVVQPEYLSTTREEIGEQTLTSDYTVGGTLRPQKRKLTRKQIQIIALVFAFGVLIASILSQPSVRTQMANLFSGMSSFPHLTDISPSDYENLKKIVRTPKSSGFLVDMAISTADPFSPSFYVATNLPHGAKFDLHILGVPETLMNVLRFEGKLSVQTEKGLGKTTALRYPDGAVIPRGEYRVFIVESGSNQPGDVLAQLAQIAETPKNAPPPVPNDRKILFEKKIFWGEKDQTYLSRLKDFHDKLKEKSLKEIGELGQMLSLMETQAQKSSADFDRLKSQALGPKQVQAWVNSSTTWNQFANQITDALSKVPSSAEGLEWVHVNLYQHLKKMNSDLIRLRQVQDSFFSKKTPLAQIITEDLPLRTSLEKNMLELKSALTQLEQSPTNAQGLPNEIAVKFLETDIPLRITDPSESGGGEVVSPSSPSSPSSPAAPSPPGSVSPPIPATSGAGNSPPISAPSENPSVAPAPMNPPTPPAAVTQPTRPSRVQTPPVAAPVKPKSSAAAMKKSLERIERDDEDDDTDVRVPPSAPARRPISRPTPASPVQGRPVPSSVPVIPVQTIRPAAPPPSAVQSTVPSAVSQPSAITPSPRPRVPITPPARVAPRPRVPPPAPRPAPAVEVEPEEAP